MGVTNRSRNVRERLLVALRRELMGPSDPGEVIKEFPTTRYIVGRLAPARTTEDDMDAAIDPTENDTLSVGAADGEDGEEEPQPPLIIGFNPSSFGLSFLIDSDVASLRTKISWGDYKRETDGDGKHVWRRYPRELVVDGIPVAKAGTIPQIVLSPVAPNPTGVSVSGADDDEICLEGVVHHFSGYRAVSLFLINRRARGATGDRAKDERWIYQPSLHVSASDGRPGFVAKDFRSDTGRPEGDSEAAINSLLYRHAREFAAGHGVAAGWDPAVKEGRRDGCCIHRLDPLVRGPAPDRPERADRRRNAGYEDARGGEIW